MKAQIPKTARKRGPLLDKWRLNGNSRLLFHGKRLTGNKFKSYTWVLGVERKPDPMLFLFIFCDLGLTGSWRDIQNDRLFDGCCVPFFKRDTKVVVNINISLSFYDNCTYIIIVMQSLVLKSLSRADFSVSIDLWIGKCCSVARECTQLCLPRSNSVSDYKERTKTNRHLLPLMTGGMHPCLISINSSCASTVYIYISMKR